VHPAPGALAGTLVNALLAHCGPSLSGIGGVRRPGIVHRLDKDTSGIMVAAKHDRAHRGLTAQFAARSVERAYQAVVWGWPAPSAGVIAGNIGRDPHHRQKMALLKAGGRAAVTRYRLVEAFASGGRPLAALLECRLETGRTHQIRVHLAHRGHPLVGDRTYGRSRSREPATPAAAFPRQALHAGLLGFRHPVGGQSLRFERRPPADMLDLLAVLRQDRLKPD